jgi:hypothetical protein
MAGKVIRRGVVIAAVLAAALVLPPFINVGRFKARVIESMGNALGRPVTADAVELRLLPQPGFFLSNVSVGDDPAYSAEPILHADEVTAYLSLSSLWRGRLEIARLKLNYPSLNLTEREDGSWNMESLLWKASRTPTAPTSARLSESRTRFPYIEATNGRINFKYGLEKSVFSFTEADFTLFSPAENQWRMRLAARPVRTDMPVTDTGTVKAEVTMQRAGMLRDSPMKATVTWERLQFGNLTRLIYGEDRGWRGALEVSAQFNGTPGALQFKTAAKLHDFRRFDISSGDKDLNATCAGELNVSASLLQNTECHLPLEGGFLSVKGTLRGLRFPRYDLAITAESLGANALLNVARRAKRDLPDDLTATGIISASFQARRMTDAPSQWVGNLVANGVAIHSAVLGKDLAVSKVVAMANTEEGVPLPGRRGKAAKSMAPVRALVVQGFNLPLGGETPATVSGQFDNQRFDLHIKGDATLERLQQFAHALGVGAPKIALAGPAAVDLVIGGSWTAFESPEVTGTAQLKNARAEVPGLSVPLEISAARVDLDHHRFTLRNASASVGKVVLNGSANFPRSCNGESPCESSFDLRTDDLNVEQWNSVLNPRLKKKPWYRLLGAGGAEHNVIASLHAMGHLTSRRMTLGTAAGTGFETDFSITDGVLALKNTRADLLGGTALGEWTMDFSGSEPKYESSGIVTRVQSEKLGTLLNVPLGTGVLGVKYKVKMAGWDASTLAKSAVAETEFTWNGGTLRIAPDGKAPWRVLYGSGKAGLDKDGWTISGSKWNTPGGIYRLSGTASRDSALALEFTQADGAVWKVTGTLMKPQQGPPAPPPTQARRR